MIFGVADVTQAALVSLAPSNDASVGASEEVCYKGCIVTYTPTYI